MLAHMRLIFEMFTGRECGIGSSGSVPSGV